MLRSQLDEHRREMDEVKAALAASYQEVRRRQHAVPATAVVKAAVRTLPLGHAVDNCTRCGVNCCLGLHCTAQRSNVHTYSALTSRIIATQQSATKYALRHSLLQYAATLAAPSTTLCVRNLSMRCAALVAVCAAASPNPWPVATFAASFCLGVLSTAIARSPVWAGLV